MTDVISAISTAAGTGGVAIIRLSGEGSLSIAARMFEPSAKIKAENFIPNTMYTGAIEGDGFSDFGMCVYFKAPKSFTGEDVVEFHCHGGVLIARGIFKKTLSLGARAAGKGEFTKRAFLNGKLSLSSAEGMIDMINAESLAALRAGGMLYGEKLTAEIKGLQNELRDVLAEIAAEIDYPEEDLEGIGESAVKARIKDISQKLARLAASYSCGKKIKDGVIVAICGKPNTGKSSLLNALLGYDKAIVSSEEGTTRDAVEGELFIDGVKFNLIDTAGIRESAGAVESVGIARAKKILQTADIILSVSDGGGEAGLSGASGKTLRIFNKCDLFKPCGEYDLAVSAKSGEGLDRLRKLLSENSVGELTLDKAYIIEQRHFAAIERANESLKCAYENSGAFTIDVLAIDLKEAWDALGEITGETVSEQIIDTVFEKFCVGK